MLSRLQADYQRLEQSLQRLTDSIAAYNPSFTAAEELVAADAVINKDLDLLVTHQSNHARIQELRQTTASLDLTLKHTVQLLAETRREIRAVPPYTQIPDSKTLQVDRLLAYAKFISRTSVPPTQRSAVVDAAAKDETSQDVKLPVTNGEILDSTLVNGNSAANEREGENIGLKSLDEQVKRMLDPLKDFQFEPWPPYAVIQQGALADIQRMVDAGKDPGSVLSAEKQAEVDRLKAEEEEREKQEQEERERRRMSAYQGGSRAAAQDDVFDPDEA